MNMQPYKNFDVTVDTRGVATVTLNVPGRALNILNRDVLTELDRIIHEFENSDDIRLIVFQSGKESGFLAGADVNAIANIESASHAMRVIETGQTLFQRIEWLTIPTVAVIHGPCLGGGLEWALACNYRVARHNSSTKIGLPEIKLGLIPGWGGTQRLPRLIGIRHAIKMILTGKHVSASEAMQIGLIDRAYGPDEWESSLPHFLDQLLSDRAASVSRRGSWRRVLEDNWLGRTVVLRMAARQVASKSKHYPALSSALRAIRLGFDKGPNGFLCERDEFVDLLASPTCRHLLDLFFARERARTVQTWSNSAEATHATPIRRVGVVGAGAMGAGIAQLSAIRGFDVVVQEAGDQAAEAGRQRIAKLIVDYARRRGWTDAQRVELQKKIKVDCDETMLAGCDLVVEAVVERENVKQQVFSTLDRVVQPAAILTSNTSSLSITRMASATHREKQVAGLHFFNPVHRMELVEVVRGSETDESTISRLVAFVKALGKTPIVTADSPGFLVNRVLFPYLGEAVRMVGEGYDIAEMDREIRRFGMPMGPIELLDQVGLDVAHHVAGTLQSVLPDAEPVVERFASLVESGHLGKKAGIGFYEYRKGKRGDAAKLPWGSIEQASARHNDYLDDGLTAIQRRLVYPMLSEAVKCQEEGVVSDAWAIDLAMVLGTGFAPHRGGPLHLIDSIGVHQVMGNLRRLRGVHGQRFAPPQRLVAMSALGHSFFGRGDAAQQEFASSP
ncbi:MAG: 3-hydroxyacyl-CoA dehydrogenase NAD-binding domain-containing protein [Rubripirellula sp.]